MGAHERNGAVLLQNAAPTPLGTHEHSRVHFLILGSGLPTKNGPVLLQNVALTALGGQAYGWFIWGTRKERALFCCRMWPRPLWAHTSTRGSIFFARGLRGRGLGNDLTYKITIRKPFQLLNLLVNGCNYAYNYHLPRKD